MKRTQILNLLQEYSGWDAEEEDMRKRMLAFVGANENCFERSLVEGHLTGSAWIVSADKRAAVMIHHKKLDRWLQPGGHADGDSDLAAVALKEAQEETQLKSLDLISDKIFDVDIHWIPDNPKDKGHFHYDVRFLIESDHTESPVVMKETKNAKWVKMEDISQLTDSRSVLRLVEKCEAK